MGQAADKKLISMAGALISMGALVSCGDSATKTLSYDAEDTGTVMPEPKKAAAEKCYGVALAQLNDCATRELSDCAGTAEEDYLPEKWKYVPAGECEEQGGTLIEPDKKFD